MARSQAIRSERGVDTGSHIITKLPGKFEKSAEPQRSKWLAAAPRIRAASHTDRVGVSGIDGGTGGMNCLFVPQLRRMGFHRVPIRCILSEVWVLAIGLRDRERLFIAGEEFVS